MNMEGSYSKSFSSFSNKHGGGVGKRLENFGWNSNNPISHVDHGHYWGFIIDVLETQNKVHTCSYLMITLLLFLSTN